jgi:hypothetical protein
MKKNTLLGLTTVTTGNKMEMTEFVVNYIPGGMGLNHSAWWLCKRELHSGVYINRPVKFLRRADYK